MLYWNALGCNLAVLGCAGLYWTALGSIGLYRAELGFPGLPSELWRLREKEHFNNHLP